MVALLKRAFSKQTLFLGIGGVAAGMLDTAVDKNAERLPPIVRAPAKIVLGALMLPMGTAGIGAGVVTISNAFGDLMGTVKMNNKAV